MTSIPGTVAGGRVSAYPSVALDLPSTHRATFDLQHLENVMSGKDFDGWTVVVTGASTGLGRAIAVDCAARGAATVVINYAANAEEAAATKALVEAEGA
ncbi:MAG TPA: SDR family NAD(P)-dependent oxidoreductase, partial [Caulobacteraceae bacterium]|nr:SDR family NAD(P)-dependent oxidoreductase [Caulobacteraceae bacterium]